jgi:hypothetical protein
MLRKSLIAAAAGAALLSGCATDPYYYDGSYAYNDGSYYYDRPAYRYYGAVPPSYYYPRYYGPPVGLSFGYSYHRHR